MQSLEETLEEIKELKRDLTANISEEKGHYEEDPRIGEEVYSKGGYYAGSSPYGSLPGEAEPIWVTDKEAVPDTKKRQNAKQRLLQVFQTSCWYSTKYESAIALGGNAQKLINQLKDILDSSALRKDEIDLDYMYKNIPDPKITTKAGKTLGYSDLRISTRIWYNNNKDIMGAVGCLITSMAILSILGYSAYYYLSR